MRLLLVSHSQDNPDSGASRVYHLLTKGLSDRGHLVKTIHLDDFRIPRFALRAAVRLFLPQIASMRARQEALDTYDIVMCSNGMLYPLFKQVRTRCRRPLLINHIHGLNFFDYQAIVTERMRGNVYQSVANRLMTGTLPLHWDHEGCQTADLTIVQNDRDLDFLVGKGILRVIRIPLSTHPAIMAAGESAPPPEARDSNMLLWFGSWTERKGINYLPRAFKAICDENPNAELTIGGTGLVDAELRQRFDIRIRSRIKVLPRLSIDDQILEFAKHSIFLFPSLSEGFGYALLEAMSMGLAAITTQTGLGADLLRDGISCRMIPAASSTHLAKAALDLMRNKPSRCRIAKRGQLLSRSLTTSRFIDSYEQCFLTSSSKLHELTVEPPASRDGQNRYLSRASTESILHHPG